MTNDNIDNTMTTDSNNEAHNMTTNSNNEAHNMNALIDALADNALADALVDTGFVDTPAPVKRARAHAPKYFAALTEPKYFDPATMVERAMSNITNAEVTTLESRFVSVVLSVRCYTADVGNKKAAEDAANANGAAKDVVKSMVNLFNNHPLLAKLKSLSGAIRTASLAMTKPSAVEGERVLYIPEIGNYRQRIEDMTTEYYEVREEFVAQYEDICREGRAALGSLVDTVRYPSVAQVRERFSVVMRIQPLSSGGVYDEIHQSARAELQDMFSDSLNHIMASMMRDAWSHLYEVIYNMVNALTDKVDDATGDSGKKRLHTATLLDKPKEYIQRLEEYNIANDPDMDEAVMELKRIVSGIDMDELREEPKFREHIKEELEEIISKFDF